MEVMRRRWRLFLGILLVVLAIVALQFSPSDGVSAAITLVTLFVVLILIISGNRGGGGGVDPHRYQSGNTGGGFGGF